MSLSIQLDLDKKHVYNPGDRVSGRVILQCVKAEDVASVEVRFWGMIEIMAADSNGHRRYHWKHTLLDSSETLFQGPYTLPSNSSHSWDFEFVFPETIRRPLPTTFAASEIFKEIIPTAPMMLPPSCRCDSESDVEISYSIIATIPRQLLDLKVKQKVIFSCWNYKGIPEPRMQRCEQKDLSHKLVYDGDGLGKPREMTSKEVWKGRLGVYGKATRTVKFRVMVEAPTVAVLGERIYFRITIRTSNASDSLTEFSLSSFQAYFQSRTIVRVPGSNFINEPKDHSALITTETRIGGFAGHFPGVSKTALPVGVPVTFGDITLNPAFLPPSFRSFAVVKVYSLCLNVSILCLEKCFQVKLQFPSLEVLPGMLWPALREVMVPVGGNFDEEVEVTGETDAPPDIGDDDIAPVYETNSGVGAEEGAGVVEDAAPAYEPNIPQW